MDSYLKITTWFSSACLSCYVIIKERKMKIKMVGLARLELATPSLSGTYSNHLSYNPILKKGFIGLMKYP
jgi:hypothetical protein